MNFELSEQELSILISSMQYMTQQQERKINSNPAIISRLYNKLTSRYDYIQRIHNEYVCDS